MARGFFSVMLTFDCPERLKPVANNQKRPQALGLEPSLLLFAVSGGIYPGNLKCKQNLLQRQEGFCHFERSEKSRVGIAEIPLRCAHRNDKTLVNRALEKAI